MRALTPRESRLIAVGLLLLLLAGAWFGLILPLLDGFALRAEARDALRNEYIHNDRILAGLVGWRAEAKRQAEEEPRFAMSIPEGMVATDVLSARLSQTVRAVGGTVQSTLPTEANVPAGWVAVRSDLRLTMSQLNAALIRLQNGEPYVVVDYLSVTAGGARQAGELERLAVRLEISAPVRVDAAPRQRRTAARHA